MFERERPCQVRDVLAMLPGGSWFLQAEGPQGRLSSDGLGNKTNAAHAAAHLKQEGLCVLDPKNLR